MPNTYHASALIFDLLGRKHFAWLNQDYYCENRSEDLLFGHTELGSILVKREIIQQIIYSGYKSLYQVAHYPERFYMCLAILSKSNILIVLPQSNGTYSMYCVDSIKPQVLWHKKGMGLSFDKDIVNNGFQLGVEFKDNKICVFTSSLAVATVEIFTPEKGDRNFMFTTFTKDDY